MAYPFTITVVVILTAAFGAVHFSRKTASLSSFEEQNHPHPQVQVHEKGDVLLMYDPECTKDFYIKCELVLFNYKTLKKNYITGQGTHDPDFDEEERYNENPQVSPDGKAIGFVRYVKDTQYYMILSVENDRQFGAFRKLTLDNSNYSNFSFTPDSQGIIYVEESRKQIYRVDLDGGNQEMLLDATLDLSYPILLQNGSLVYSALAQFNRGQHHVYRVCMNKTNGNCFCWNKEFSNEPKLFSHGHVVYAVDKNTVTKIDTNNPNLKLNSISVAEFPHLLNGTVSNDGKFLHLIVNNILDDELRLIKVNIEGAFENETSSSQISNEVVMSAFIGEYIAMVPNFQ